MAKLPAVRGWQRADLFFTQDLDQRKTNHHHGRRIHKEKDSKDFIFPSSAIVPSLWLN